MKQRVALQRSSAHEREAEAIGARVAASREPSRSRIDAHHVPSAGADTLEAPSVVGDVLSSPGRALEEGTRGAMEQRFGRDFGHIRVHTNAAAADSAEALNARAFTAGHHIVFGPRQYQPHSTPGRALLAHELSHTIQQGRSAPPHLIQRSVKFEIQTQNPILRTSVSDDDLHDELEALVKGDKAVEGHFDELPRKFGPESKQFLHGGKKGKPARKGHEATAIELQSEKGGFIEFETPKWFRKWCDVKERIEEAVEMTKTIDKAPELFSSKGVRFVEWPFPIDHLKKATKFKGGLKRGERLIVRIDDKKWRARIQASESIELTQYESLLKEHEKKDFAKHAVKDADEILTASNTEGLTKDEVARLRSFLQMIVDYVYSGQHRTLAVRDKDKKIIRRDPAKFAFSLMVRTPFSDIYRHLLTPKERKLFRSIVTNKQILTQMGLDVSTKFFVEGHGGGTNVTVHKWLTSIFENRKDLLSPPSKGSAAMGARRLETKAGDKDENLVKFEVRGSRTHVVDRNRNEWVKYAEEIFKQAAHDRSRSGHTALKYNKDKCK